MKDEIIASSCIESRGFPIIPSSWYPVSTSKDLPVGAVIHAPFCGRDIAVFRTASGQVRAVGMYCPHLGASLAHGGKVVEESIECPMHGLRFNGEGQCTGADCEGRLSNKLRVDAYITDERNGLIFVWHGSSGESPEWNIPEIDLHGFTEKSYRSKIMASHPQDIHENSVDYKHFKNVHGFQGLNVKSSVTDGPIMKLEMESGWVTPSGKKIEGLKAVNSAQTCGLGYATVRSEWFYKEKLFMHVQYYLLTMPISVDSLKFTYVVQVKMERNGFLGMVAAEFMRRLMRVGFGYDLSKDFPIWSNKKYVARPAICEFDGPIGLFRKWVRQFYPGNRDAED